jgi:hypothetical protein
MSIVHVSPSVVKNLNRPVYPSFLRQTRISDWKGRFRVALVLGPFFIIKTSCIWRFACKRRISFVILRIASARYIIKGNRAELSIILGYIPNTSNIGTIPSGPAKSLIALTVIYSAISALISSWSSSRMIL